MLDILISPFARIIGIVVLVAALFGFGYWKGYSSEHEKFNTFKTEIETVSARRIAENQALKKEDEIRYKGLKNELASKTLLLKRYYATSGVQHNPSGNTVLPAQGSSSGANGTPSYEVLIGQCAETTLKYTLLQDYVKGLNLPQ